MTKLILGVNDLATLRPDLAKQWDMYKNGDIRPTMVTCGSQKNIWWICAKGHSFMSAVTTRIRMNTNCPYCSNKAVLKGFNDMMTTNPELARDWDYEKNVSLKPYEVCAGTGKLIWWKCHVCGGSWKAKGADRNRGIGCPFCKNKRTQKGLNDLKSANPILASEWNYTKNSIQPDMLVEGSKKKVWWICKECGMEWSATVDNRKRGNGCPKCNRRNQTSFPEQAIMYYILKNYPDAVNGYTDVFSNGMELDIFIPSLHLGIEYDGRAWHNSEISLKREKIKYEICKKEKIFLIRIKEVETNFVDQTSDAVVLADKSLDKTILKLQKYLDISDVNTERDRQIIMSQYYNSVKGRSLEVVAPQISIEWDYNKNGYLKPLMFLPNSGEKVWWICAKGHSYKTSIAHRSEGKGCPYCSNQKVLTGFNDLKTICPEISEEWDYEKNGELLPEKITAKSGKDVWWKCKNGHSWKAKPLNRQKGGCPYCGGKKVLVGYNDLESLFPQLSQEWDYDKNDDKKPNQYTCGSNVVVYWKCKNGHSWKATIYDRTKGCGCPKCSKKQGARKRAKKVMCVESGEIFECTVDAAEKFSIDRRQISNCINGRQKTAGGFHWQVINRE